MVDFYDLQVQTFLLRMVHSFIILAVGINLFVAARHIDNERLTSIIWKVSIFVLSFFFSRISAGIIDSYYAFSIGWLSNIVNIIFWLVLWYKASRLRAILSSAKNAEVRIELRDQVDVFITKLEQAKANLAPYVKR